MITVETDKGKYQIKYGDLFIWQTNKTEEKKRPTPSIAQQLTRRGGGEEEEEVRQRKHLPENLFG